MASGLQFSELQHFRPSGPVSARFLADNTSIVKAILGPVGGGKSVSNVYDCIRRPSFMPACNDGVVRYRRAIVGATYGQIERNLYPTWKRWLPEDGGSFTQIADWKGGGGRSAVHKLAWNVHRGHREVRVEAEYVFAAVGEMSVEDFVRGFEPTDFWLYEVDLLPEQLLYACVTRLGRYPATGSASDALRRDLDFRTQVSCDLNAPDTDSWFYKTFEENPPKGFKVYKQPSGLSPQAENIAHLRKGYYETQVEVLSKQPGGRHLVTRMVHARYAPSRIGMPVYELYDDATHLAPVDLKPAPGVPIVLGFDQGKTAPACVGFQQMPSGQRRVLFEVAPGFDALGLVSPRRFAEMVAAELILVAPGHPLAEAHYCDPAGFSGADKEDGETAWAEMVAAELGIVILPAETQELTLRMSAVNDYLRDKVGAAEPAFFMSKRCRHLRKGFVSHYMFERRPSEKSQMPKPIKNLYSDPHDALQYGFLGLSGRFGAIQGLRDPRAPERAIGQRALAFAEGSGAPTRARPDFSIWDV
jgi:hypothetical protein